jgi:hypothetical protein
MLFLAKPHSWLRRPFGRAKAPSRPRLQVEVLEERNLLSAPPTLVNSPGGIVPPPPNQGQIGDPLQPNPVNPPGTIVTNPPGDVPPVQGADSFQQLVDAMYNHALYRAPTAGEDQSWISLLESGMSSYQVAQGFMGSTEHQIDIIRGDYERILGRDPEASAVANWLPLLQSAGPERLAASILASDEFFLRSGGTLTSWLEGVYSQTLGRGVDATGLAAWSQWMQAGASRFDVASQIATSWEADANIVSNLYQADLLRAPEPAGLTSSVMAMQQGETSNQLGAAIMGSPEFAQVQSTIPTYGYVTITGITPDNGVSSSDGVTNSTTLTVSGQGTPNTNFTLYDDFAVDSQGQTDAGGRFSIALSKSLAEGRHYLGVAPNSMPAAPAISQAFLVQVDLTAPTLTFTAPDFTTSLTPTVTVAASDNMRLDGLVHIDVDLNNNGTFTDPGETNFAVQALMAGSATFNLPKLKEGTYQIRARVDDLAGNETSSIATTQIDPNAGILGSQDLINLYWYNYFQNLGGSNPSNPGTPGGTSPTPPSGPPPTSPGGGYPMPSKQPRVDTKEFLYDAKGRVLIDVRATLTKYMGNLQTELQNLGMNVDVVTPSQNMITGYLPINKILDLPNQAHFSAATPVLKPKLSTGSVDTEGDSVIQADTFRASTGFDGSGVKVGVLSDSVSQFAGGLADSVNTGDLPNNVQVLEDGPAGSTDEGRAMLEIVDDIAPGASLAFHTAFNGEQDFATGITDLANAGAKVIADDVGYFDSPMFNDGIIAQAVDTVHSQGAFYASAAGNNANQGWTDSWRPADNQTVGGVTGTFENFSTSGTNVLQQFTLNPGDELDLSFQWDSAFLEGGSPLPNYQVPNDLAVLVTSSDGATLEQTFDANNKNTDMAWENVAFLNDGSFGTSQFALAFQMHNPTTDPAPTMLRWVVVGSVDPMADGEGAATTFGQPAAKGAVAVGAVPWFQPDTPESFTSQGGPLTFLFDANGNRLASPEIRNKPEVAAPDGVSTSFFGDPSGNQAHAFFGTSAATPHVAGAAALLMQQAPSATNDDIIQHLEDTAIDVPPAGFDNLTGFGRIVVTPIVLVFPPDRFEVNETSDAPTNFGALAPGTTTITDLTIANHPNGLSDYDWYRFTAGSAGTVTATINRKAGGDLELHLFTVDSNNTLIELGSDTTPRTATHTVSAAFSPGQVILVEVKGRERRLGVWDQGSYDLTMTLQ